MIFRFILFLAINSAALLIGGLFTNSGVNSEWYTNFAKAPWTPPGWVFGVAWTTIMIFLALYMASAYAIVKDKGKLLGIFALQWILNVVWNPLFFYLHFVTIALISISALTVLLGWWMVVYKKEMGAKSFFLLPYFVWLVIASSLNAYILFMN